MNSELTLTAATSQGRQSEAVRQQRAVVRGQTKSEQPPTPFVESVGKNRQQTKQKPRIAGSKGKSHHSGRQNGTCPRCGNDTAHARDKCPAAPVKCNKCTMMLEKPCQTLELLMFVNVELSCLLPSPQLSHLLSRQLPLPPIYKRHFPGPMA